MPELLPMWPIWLAVGVIVAAVLVWCACAATPSHRPTKNGVSFCDDCSVVCTGAYPCLCCRELGFHRGGETRANSETDRRIRHARRSNG
jgi:hypothetical protein